MHVRIGKKKKFALNLNAYRNAHFLTLNKAKIAFKKAVEHLIEPLPYFERIVLTYTVYPQTMRMFDVANVCSVVDKFFSDALVEFGKLEDDNYHYLPEVHFKFGELDRLNPRVEVELSSPDQSTQTKEMESDSMKITLNNAYITHLVNITTPMPDGFHMVMVDAGSEYGEVSIKLEMHHIDLSQDPVVAPTPKEVKQEIQAKSKPVSKPVETPVEKTPEPEVVTETQPEPVAEKPKTKTVSLFAKKTKPDNPTPETVAKEQTTEEAVQAISTGEPREESRATSANPFGNVKGRMEGGPDDDGDATEEGTPPETEAEPETEAPKKASIFKFDRK
ncbi:MAG: hypothetical protein JKY54_11250 [Flavobacteriales bacterium]|nr:hypothetical protein [Flavobacteriales bacterium]